MIRSVPRTAPTATQTHRPAPLQHGLGQDDVCLRVQVWGERRQASGKACCEGLQGRTSMKGMRRSSYTPQRLQPPRVSVVSGLSSAAQAYGRPCNRASYVAPELCTGALSEAVLAAQVANLAAPLQTPCDTDNPQSAHSRRDALAAGRLGRAPCRGLHGSWAHRLLHLGQVDIRVCSSAGPSVSVGPGARQRQGCKRRLRTVASHVYCHPPLNPQAVRGREQPELCQEHLQACVQGNIQYTAYHLQRCALKVDLRVTQPVANLLRPGRAQARPPEAELPASAERCARARAWGVRSCPNRSPVSVEPRVLGKHQVNSSALACTALSHARSQRNFHIARWPQTIARTPIYTVQHFPLPLPPYDPGLFPALERAPALWPGKTEVRVGPGASNSGKPSWSSARPVSNKGLAGICMLAYCFRNR